jgi:hypothetical protein
MAHLIVLIGYFAGLSSFCLGQSQAELPTLTIGVVIDGPWQHNARIQDLFVTEITSFMADDYEVRFPDDLIITADWTVPNIKAVLDRLYADPNVDIVITNGVIASDMVCHWPDALPKPTIAPYAIDLELQQLPLQ